MRSRSESVVSLPIIITLFVTANVPVGPCITASGVGEGSPIHETYNLLYITKLNGNVIQNFES